MKLKEWSAERATPYYFFVSSRAALANRGGFCGGEASVTLSGGDLIAEMG